MRAVAVRLAANMPAIVAPSICNWQTARTPIEIETQMDPLMVCSMHPCHVGWHIPGFACLVSFSLAFTFALPLLFLVLSAALSLLILHDNFIIVVSSLVGKGQRQRSK